MIFGRPPKYKTPKELEEVIIKYFKSLRNAEDTIWLRPPTVTGLALALGLSRQGLIEYNAKNDFSDTITRAKQMVEQFNEEHLLTSKSAHGVAFNLKNNFGWKDKREEEVTHKGDIGAQIIAARNRAGIKDDD